MGKGTGHRRERPPERRNYQGIELLHQSGGTSQRIPDRRRSPDRRFRFGTRIAEFHHRKEELGNNKYGPWRTSELNHLQRHRDCADKRLKRILLYPASADRTHEAEGCGWKYRPDKTGTAHAMVKGPSG